MFGRSLHQHEYQILRKGFENGLSKKQVRNIFLHQNVLACANLSPLQAIDEFDVFRDDCTMIPDPADLNTGAKNLLILDDCFLGKQNKAEAYDTRGRHNNCNTFHISQNYFRLPRQIIRENANLIILFPQNAKNLIHRMSVEEFKKFCRNVWKVKHNFVTIELTSGKLNEKYRKNLDCFYHGHLEYTVGKVKITVKNAPIDFYFCRNQK